MATPPVFGVVGWKNSGKTTLTTRLVTELSVRGYRVSTIKHAHHRFDVDHPGKDSFRHRQAGAHQVAIASPVRWAVMTELRGAPEPSLQQMLARLDPCDVVIVEGYKHDAHPKVEVRRLDARERTPIAPSDPTIVAVAADHATDTGGLPAFQLDQVDALTSLIEDVLDLSPSDAARPR